MGCFNITKKYPELLDLLFLDEMERNRDLLAIFKRDIEENECFAFKGHRIYPIKSDGVADMGRLFKHLTCEEITVLETDGRTYSKRVFEIERSKRLHWINHHISERTPLNVDIFTVEEKDHKKRKVRKTYIFDAIEKYVIVLEQQRSGSFYLLTAYYLNKDFGLKALQKKMKKRLPTPI